MARLAPSPLVPVEAVAVRLTWLADVLRGAGCDVYEMPGWKGRGKDLVSVQGVVWHHTASGPKWQDGHVAALLRDGRRDLAGPLSQLGLERDGTFVVIADGKANHNGYGMWGNQAVGVEAYNDGIGEPWPQAQLDAYDLGTAAILAHLNYGADRMKGHRETDPHRKIDPTGIDLDAARIRIDRLIEAGFHPTPKDWLMALTDKQQTELYDAVMRLDKFLGHSGKEGRQVLADIDKRTDDLAAGRRPTKKG